MDIFKENKEFWFYLIGIVLLFFLFFWGASYFLRGEFFGIGGEDNEETQIPNTFDEPPAFTIDTDKDYVAEFETNLGNFKVDLFERNAPNNVNNFVFLAGNAYYDNIKVHRMIKDLLIQSGSRATTNENPADDDLGNPGYVVKDEINWDSLDLNQRKRDELTALKYETNPDVISRRLRKYSLVMANADRANSSGSQYFIVIGEDADPRVEFLRGRHTVIGEVVEGRDIIDRIRQIEVVEEESTNIPRPKDEVIIRKVLIKIQ